MRIGFILVLPFWFGVQLGRFLRRTFSWQSVSFGSPRRPAWSLLKNWAPLSARSSFNWGSDN